VVTAVLVTSAATLIESVPFILAGAALQRLPLRCGARMPAYLGCGCGTGPAARSLPAAAAAWLVFGPAVAAARFGAAVLFDRVRRPDARCEHAHDAALGQFAAIAPLAIAGAVSALLAPALFGVRHVPALAFAGGAVFAFFASPCGIGAVGLAAAVRGAMPAAAAGFLCVAGIADMRTWLRAKPADSGHDAFAYALAAAACALVAARGGGGLIHPKLALLLWPCAAACFALAARYRGEVCAKLRVAPAIMLLGAVLAAPPPEYHATETTLADAFAGERIDFTGLVTQTGSATTLVRYAITCCRADAAPVVVRLQKPLPALKGWMHARGMLVNDGGELRLRADQLRPVAAPADPFVYR
jgi:hypothetical protein